MLLSEIFDRYVRDVLPTLAPRTQRDYMRHLRVLRERFGHMDADDVKPRDVGAFLDVPTGRIQRNRQAAVLSAVYAKAVGRWYVAERNPCQNVERNPSSRRTRYVTDEEYIAFYEIAPKRMRLAMDLAFVTGQRQGDILDLKWDQVMPDGIKLQQGKTGKRLMIARSPVVNAILERAKLMDPITSEYVLHTRTGKRYTSEGFRACWQRAMRKAISRGLVAGERWTFHDLRAKCVSDSTSLESAFERAGHTTMAMTRSVYDRNYRLVTPLK